jgi:hypothetical protein
VGCMRMGSMPMSRLLPRHRAASEATHARPLPVREGRRGRPTPGALSFWGCGCCGAGVLPR